MTTPEDRTRAVMRTRQFLRDLADARATPRIPKRLREQALSLLKHYPQDHHLELAARHCPQSWGLPGESLAAIQGPSAPPRPERKRLDELAGMLKSHRHVSVEEMNPYRDWTVQDELKSVADSICDMPSTELARLIRDSEPLAAQLREVFEFLATPDVQQLIRRR